MIPALYVVATSAGTNLWFGSIYIYFVHDACIVFVLMIIVLLIMMSMMSCIKQRHSQDGDSDWVMLPPSWMGGDRAEYSRMELAGFLQQILESVMDGARNSL